MVLILGLMLWLGWFVFKSVRARFRHLAASPVLHRSDDANGVPIVASFTGIKGMTPWLAIASNSLNPVLNIGPDYLEYRVLRTRRVPLSHIQSVRLMTAIGTANLHFTFKSGPFTFAANLGDQDRARLLLDQLKPRLG